MQRKPCSSSKNHICYQATTCKSQHTQKLCLVLQHNAAELQVHVAGSSIAMLQGQRPPFRLLVRATSARDGRRLDSIKPAVSDAFVVSPLPLQVELLSRVRNCSCMKLLHQACTLRRICGKPTTPAELNRSAESTQQGLHSYAISSTSAESCKCQPLCSIIDVRVLLTHARQVLAVPLLGLCFLLVEKPPPDHWLPPLPHTSMSFSSGSCIT